MIWIWLVVNYVRNGVVFVLVLYGWMFYYGNLCVCWKLVNMWMWSVDVKCFDDVWFGVISFIWIEIKFF